MSVLIVDTETTGVSPPVVPVEVGMIKLAGHPEDFRCIYSVNQRYNPGRSIETGAIATHHILPSDLISEPIWAGVILPDPVTYLVGHNIDYDWKVIGEPDVPRICTLALSRFLWPELDSHKLAAVVYHVMGPTEVARKMLRQAHSALVDCELVAVILTKIIELLNPRSWEELWQHSERARVPTRMPFGKHGPKDGKPGLLIKDLDRVDPGYRSWLLKQKDIDPYLVKALKEQR